MKKIALVTTGHPPSDERIYWKFAKSLSENNKVAIFCSTEDIDKISDSVIIKGFDSSNINKREKTLKLYQLLSNFYPEIIICCEPLAVIPASRFKKLHHIDCKIISDVTEWYPENICSKLHGVNRVLKYIILFLFNVYTINKVDRIIIGEIAKKRRYNIIAPFKKKTIVGYYPVLKYFDYYEPLFNDKILTFCYSGVITFQRGIVNLLEASMKLARRHSNLKIKFKIIGKFTYVSEEEKFRLLCDSQNLVEIERINWTEYSKISDYFFDVDICFDLRKKTFIFKNSLPIKIFEYMACGKPFIYSDIDPIKRELQYEKFGFLVEPNKIDQIIEKIEVYINDVNLLKLHSKNARREVEEEKNWERESNKLINLISSLI